LVHWHTPLLAAGVAGFGHAEAEETAAAAMRVPTINHPVFAIRHFPIYRAACVVLAIPPKTLVPAGWELEACRYVHRREVANLEQRSSLAIAAVSQRSSWKAPAHDVGPAHIQIHIPRPLLQVSL